MATPSGQIGLSDVNAELGYSPTALITMNDAAVRTLAGVGGAGTPISMQNLQNKSNRVSIPLTISSSTYNYNVYNSRGPTYDPGKSDITVTINPGVTVGSTSTGTYAFSIPSSFNPADTITVVNNGVIQGMGGAGGASTASAPLPPGSSGGIAILAQRPATITNNGVIAGGGGGGGGGVCKYNLDPESGAYITSGGGGGGGGAGYDGGAGGAGGPPGGGTSGSAAGQPGSSGTSPAGGSGGVGYMVYGPSPSQFAKGQSGGAGGGRGASGSAPANDGFGASFTTASTGGAAGAYISGAPYITWPATGTRLGPSS